MGWTGTGLSSATKSVSISKGTTGNRTYTATWQIAQIVVMTGGTLQGSYVGATPNMRTIQDCSSFAALYSRITNGTGWEMGCHPVNYSGGFYTTLNKPVNLTGISTISFTISQTTHERPKNITTQLGVSTGVSTNSFKVATGNIGTGSGTYTIDVSSLSGNHYLTVYHYHKSWRVYTTITKIVLSP